MGRRRVAGGGRLPRADDEALAEGWRSGADPAAALVRAVRRGCGGAAGNTSAKQRVAIAVGCRSASRPLNFSPRVSRAWDSGSMSAAEEHRRRTRAEKARGAVRRRGCGTGALPAGDRAVRGKQAPDQGVSELGARAGRTREVREVRTRTTRATTCLLSCMAAANVGLWPGASQGQAVDGEQKRSRSGLQRSWRNRTPTETQKASWDTRNVTTAVGYYNFPFLLDAGSITDDDFVLKGRTQTVISRAQMSEGEVTGKPSTGIPSSRTTPSGQSCS